MDNNPTMKTLVMNMNNPIANNPTMNSPMAIMFRPMSQFTIWRRVSCPQENLRRMLDETAILWSKLL